MRGYINDQKKNASRSSGKRRSVTRLLSIARQRLSADEAEAEAEAFAGQLPAPQSEFSTQGMERRRPVLGPGSGSFFRDSGIPLPISRQKQFGRLLGMDLSRVRIHAGREAAGLAEQMNSRAFTRGQHIAFNAGEYRPETSAGTRLLAHELAHVAQQARGAVPTNSIQRQPKPVRPAHPGDSQQQLRLSEQQKRKVTATVLAESYIGQEETIKWVYYNRILADGFERGLRASNAYRKNEIWYRIWMIALGDSQFQRQYGNLPYPGEKGFTVRRYLETSAFARRRIIPRAQRLHASVNSMFAGRATNPFRGWIGQGNLGDLNLNYGKWREARQYLYLQRERKVLNRWVEELPSESGSASFSYIFHETAIHRFFRLHPELLPDNVPAYRP